MKFLADEYTKNGISIDKPTANKFGDSSLIAASQKGKEDVVEFLLHSGNADVNYRRKLDGNDAIYMAAQGGRLNVVKHLQSQGAKIDSENTVLRHPLWIAAFYGHLTTVQYIAGEYIKQNISIDKTEKQKWTSLHVAAQGRWLDVIKFLGHHGADINAKTSYNKTPLYWAGQKKPLDTNGINVVEYLKSKGAI